MSREHRYAIQSAFAAYAHCAKQVTQRLAEGDEIGAAKWERHGDAFLRIANHAVSMTAQKDTRYG